LDDFFGLDDQKTFPDQPLFFVTLTDVSCTINHDASRIDISKFKRKVQAGLRGLNYVGMVEPGLYVNVAPGTVWTNKKAVSWHLHATCWGENRREMKKRFAQLNRDSWYVSILNSQRGADQKEIPDACLPKNRDRTFLADKLRYVLKSPRKAYRIYKTERMTGDGELVPCFRQRKSELRKGDRITLFHLMKNLRLPGLAAAGGDGTDIMRRRYVVLESDRLTGDRVRKVSNVRNQSTQKQYGQDLIRKNGTKNTKVRFRPLSVRSNNTVNKR
jgi:hypothetical protein